MSVVANESEGGLLELMLKEKPVRKYEIRCFVPRVRSEEESLYPINDAQGEVASLHARDMQRWGKKSVV
jgi:hypothetical protein